MLLAQPSAIQADRQGAVEAGWLEQFRSPGFIFSKPVLFIQIYFHYLLEGVT